MTLPCHPPFYYSLSICLSFNGWGQTTKASPTVKGTSASHFKCSFPKFSSNRRIYRLMKINSTGISTEKNFRSKFHEPVCTSGLIALQFPVEAANILFTSKSRPALGAPVSYIKGTGVKRPESEAIHSPPSNIEVKYAWSYMPPSTPPIRLHDVALNPLNKVSLTSLVTFPFTHSSTILSAPSLSPFQLNFRLTFGQVRYFTLRY
jgi:hypothetical protein